MRVPLMIGFLVLTCGVLIGCSEDDPVSPGNSGTSTLSSQLDSLVINLVQWTFADGGNGHYYAVLPREIYWEDADAFTDSLALSGWTSCLATPCTAAENAFLLDHVVAGTNQPSVDDQFWLGGTWGSGSWSWMSGEEWDYANWASGEPNNVGIETVLTMWGPTNTQMNRTPGTWNNSLPDQQINPRVRYWGVVEFETAK